MATSTRSLLSRASGQGRAFIPFDFDADGDLDVLTTENRTSPHLYRNDVGSAVPWLRVRLDDPSSTIAELRIVWPDGAEQLLTDIGVRQALRIVRAP